MKEHETHSKEKQTKQRTLKIYTIKVPIEVFLDCRFTTFTNIFKIYKIIVYNIMYTSDLKLK